jgi:hypothetical protein
MASMEKKDAIFLVIDIIERHVDFAVEEEIVNLATEIIDRLENIEIYDKSDIHNNNFSRREWPQDEDE